mgnify:CR=1 FL=1
MQQKASKENELRQFLQLQNVLDKEIERYDEIMNELANISKVIETAEALEEIQRLKELQPKILY